AAAACQVLAGYPEYAFDTGLTLALLWPFLAARPWRDGTMRVFVRGTAFILAAAALAGLASAVQWVSLLETVRESVRAAGDYEFMFGMRANLARFGGGLGGLISALSLLFYLPPFAWVCLIAGAFVPGLRLRWGTIALAAVCFSIGPLHDVPPFSMFRGPVCWVSILHVPLALHAGWGLDQVVSGSRRAGLVALCAAVAMLPLLGLRAAAWLVMGALTLLLM